MLFVHSLLWYDEDEQLHKGVLEMYLPVICYDLMTFLFLQFFSEYFEV